MDAMCITSTLFEGLTMTTTTAVFERVYIWERPVRLYHWTTAVSVVVLAATGFIIGSPPAFMTTAEASGSQWFGLVRLTHFASGFIFTFAFLLRLYWFFAGNQYARWSNFLPLTPTLFKREAKQVLDVIETDLLQLKKQPLHVKGHNALAAWTYTAIFALTIFQMATGLALYAPMSGWWFPQVFAWIVPLMGGDAEVRMWHHLGMWVFSAFILVHVYLSLFHDYVEGQGEISSMISGVKFMPREKP
jgi:Ni/Fe-hydrogenase 1 B-type cytochrome subunit